MALVPPVSGYFSLITYGVADLGVDELEGNGGDEVFEAVTAPSAVNPSPFKIIPFATILRQRGIA